MSAHDIDAVMTKIGKSKQCECGSGATADAIEHAQRALGNTFPDDYSAFLQRFGWAVVKECDVFGLGDGIPSYMDVVLTTKSERTEMEPRLLARYVALMNDGAGNHYCLDCDKLSAGQCPVVLWAVSYTHLTLPTNREV